jgi:hypothetical protein
MGLNLSLISFLIILVNVTDINPIRYVSFSVKNVGPEAISLGNFFSISLLIPSKRSYTSEDIFERLVVITGI